MSDSKHEWKKTLAERLEYLFETVPGSGPGGKLTLQEVVDGIRARGSEPISTTLLWELREGVKDNPRMRHLEALADFFDVPVGYFFDEEVARRVEADLRLLSVMRNNDVRRIAFRASELSPEALNNIADMIEGVSMLEKRRRFERGEIEDRRATDKSQEQSDEGDQ